MEYAFDKDYKKLFEKACKELADYAQEKPCFLYEYSCPLTDTDICESNINNNGANVCWETFFIEEYCDEEE